MREALWNSAFGSSAPILGLSAVLLVFLSVAWLRSPLVGSNRYTPDNATADTLLGDLGGPQWARSRGLCLDFQSKVTVFP